MTDLLEFHQSLSRRALSRIADDTKRTGVVFRPARAPRRRRQECQTRLPAIEPRTITLLFSQIGEFV